MNLKILFFLSIVFLTKNLFGQENQINISTEFFVNDEYASEMFPNQNGVYDTNANSYIIVDYLKKTKNIDFLFKTVFNENNVSINQFGIGSRFNNHFFKIGILPYQPRRDNDFVLSNHSEPFLNFQFGNIKNIKFKSFLIEYDFLIGQLNSRENFSFEFDYDQFVDSEYLINPYLHKKTLNIGYKINKNELWIGITHGVMFGGKIRRENDIYKPDRTFRAFMDAFFSNALPNSSDESGSLDKNIEGNHLGFWNLELIREDFEIYFNKIFDDGSGLWFNNKFDGIWGVTFKPKGQKIKTFGIELTATKHQSGNVHPSGVDSYYWHHIYTSGWYINDLSLGHPLISPYNNRMNALKLFILYNFNDNYSLDSFSYIIDRYNNYGHKGTSEGIIFENDDPERVYIGNINVSRKFKNSKLLFSIGYKLDDIKLVNYKIRFEKELIF